MSKKIKKHITGERFTKTIVIISLICSIILFAINRTIAMEIRGTEYLGGEMVILLIPFMVWATIENLKLESDYAASKRKRYTKKKTTVRPAYSVNNYKDWNNTVKIDKIDSIEIIKEW